MLQYDGANMAWKGYVRNLNTQVGKLSNAVGYPRPSTAETEALQRCSIILNMLDKSVSIWYSDNYLK